jgi:hypothetical protein
VGEMIRKNIPRKQTSSTKVSQSSLSQEQLTEKIRKAAYELYEKRGRTPGNELVDWFEAERQIKKELQPDILRKKKAGKRKNVE